MTRLITISAVTFVFAIAAVVLASGADQKNSDSESPTAAGAASKETRTAPVVKKSRKGKDQKPEQSDKWMLFKLTSSQAMFTDLTHGNLKGVAKHARASTVVDVLEYWLRGKEFRQRSEYHKQLNKYQFAVRELARHAEDNNIDGALESWLDINRSCVQCHKLLRDSVKVDATESETAPVE